MRIRKGCLTIIYQSTKEHGEETQGNLKNLEKTVITMKLNFK